MFRLKVEPDGGEPFEVEAKSRDVVRWEKLPPERGAPPRNVGRLESAARMTDLTELAWCAAERRGLTSLSLKEFLDQVDVDAVRAVVDDDGVAVGSDPTQPAP